MCGVSGHETDLHDCFGPSGEMRGNLWDLKEVYGDRLVMTKDGFTIKE